MKKSILVVFAVLFLFGVVSSFAMPRINTKGVNFNITPRINGNGMSFHMNSSDFQYVQNNVQLSMDKTCGILIKVDESYLRFMISGNEISGNIIIVSNVGDPVVIPYDTSSGSFVCDLTGIEQVVQEFRSSLNPSQILRLDSVEEKVATLINQLVKSDSKEISQCEAAGVSAIVDFATCPLTGGVGCITGVFALYVEWRACS